MNPASDTLGAPPRNAVDRHRAALFPWVKPLYSDPLALSEGEGVWVRDRSGQAYLDMFGGILTTSIGHSHPRIVEAVATQARRLGHTSALYVTEPQIEAAEKIARLAPGDLERSAFTNSGSEAIETALMAACLFTGRTEIVALRYGYSGRTAFGSALTGHASWRPVSGRVSGITHARAPYVYRSPLDPEVSEQTQTDFFIDDLIEVIETTTAGRPAALLLEPILGVGGYIVPPAGYLHAAAEVIRSYGGLLISDEVQTGFGRTGDRWFGIEHADVVPDIMVMAKGIAGGFPVGATVTRSEIADAWTPNSISTFGGNPVCMAAAVATISVMEEENVPERARARGAELRTCLETLEADLPWIGDVRGMGLMQALELVEDPLTKQPSPRRARALLEAAKEEGLLIGLGGRYGHVVRLGPSLLITEDELEGAMTRFERACMKADATS